MFKWHLKRILRKKELSQSEFSRRTDVRKATVFAYCHGYVKEARIKDLHAMCKELECQISDIIEYSPDKK
jgi:DNA-binding Xre family transcriptional regulator